MHNARDRPHFASSYFCTEREPGLILATERRALAGEMRDRCHNSPELRHRAAGLAAESEPQRSAVLEASMVPGLDIWLNHFEYHANALRAVPEDLANVLTREEREAIADSIATFQLGEQSEGGTLLRAAQVFADRHDIPSLARITELFIREEQHHAALLGTFMDAHGIPRKQQDWTDWIFRGVRKLRATSCACTCSSRRS